MTLATRRTAFTFSLLLLAATSSCQLLNTVYDAKSKRAIGTQDSSRLNNRIEQTDKSGNFSFILNDQSIKGKGLGLTEWGSSR